MTRILTTAAIAAVLATGAFAAHDQGVADGTQPFEPGELAGQVDDAVRNGLDGNGDTDAPGVARGEAARAAKGDNRTVPVVND